MIVGHGLIATALQDFVHLADLIIFASGPSDSRESRPQEFEREQALLERCLSMHQHLVYFGTCSVYDPSQQSSPYVLHKTAMEMLIERCAQRYTIFRLPQVVGPQQNPANIAAAFWINITQSIPFEVWENATRYVIDIEDVARLARTYLKHEFSMNRAINLAPPHSVSPLRIARVLESIAGREGQYRVVDQGTRYAIPPPELDVSPEAGVDFSASGYLEKVLSKYFQRDARNDPS